MFNIPSMNGYNVYPLGNFLFIPLSVLAYGVLKYRLMAIRSLLLQSVSWVIVSSLVLVLNSLFLLWVYDASPRIDRITFATILSMWFIINFYYFRKVQPAINNRLNRSDNQMNQAVNGFIANVFFLRDIEELVTEFLDLMKRYLAIPHASIYIASESFRSMVNPVNEESIALTEKTWNLIEAHPYSISLDTIDTHPLYSDAAPELTRLLKAKGDRYIVPLVKTNQLVGLVLMPLPTHGMDLLPNEFRFLDKISVAGLAFFNSTIYKNMANLKEKLEKRTVELSMEIEERLQIETALRKSEEEHRLMAENIRDVIWTLDMDLKFTYISPAVKKMQGWSVEEFMHFSFDEFMPFESIEKAKTALTETLLHGEKTGDFSRHATLELEQFTKWGKIIKTEVTASFMLDSRGQPCGILGVTRDISDRIQAAMEREELQEQLARSKKMEALGMLAGGVAHDLNNILSGIMSYSQVIMMNLPKDSTLIKPLQTIQHCGQRAAAVVNDLVTIARGVASNHEVADLNRLVTGHLVSAEHLELMARHPNAHVDVLLEDNLRNIRCSRIHIEKVLMNLLANAAEALDASGVITISTKNSLLDHPVSGYDAVHAGEYTMLSVSDTGGGIPPKDLNRIFEPFYTKKIMGRSGTGLGLAIVWNTVQDHEGYITVASGANGTCFDLYFPSTRSKIANDGAKTPLDAYKGNGETILVVDDDPTQREIASAMLNSLGYRVNTVDSGEAAIAYVEKHRTDLMLLDMIMEPGMNGRDTYQAVSRIRPGQRAIIASGFSESSDVAEAQRLGAGILLKKPYSIDKLGQAVMSALAISTTNE